MFTVTLITVIWNTPDSLDDSQKGETVDDGIYQGRLQDTFMQSWLCC